MIRHKNKSGGRKMQSIKRRSESDRSFATRLVFTRLLNYLIKEILHSLNSKIILSKLIRIITNFVNIIVTKILMIHPMLYKAEIAPEDNMPAHWEILNKIDLREYLELRNYFYEQIRKTKKGTKHDNFTDRLNRIKEYIERGDGDDWKRSIVCGVIFLTNALAINIQQLRILLGKCKSSINGSLQQLGYISVSQSISSEPELQKKFLF